MSLNLIEKALQYANEEYNRLLSLNLGIYEPLYPKARRNLLYLRLRECLNVGCRHAVKLLDNPHHRSIAYSILMKATYLIFQTSKRTDILNHYNGMLDKLIGTH